VCTLAQAAQPSSGALGAKAPLAGGLPPWSDPQSEPCAACRVCRYTFEPPSVFCTSCSQRIKRNQARRCLDSLSKTANHKSDRESGGLECAVNC
jgi:hypothetical protein